MFGVKVGGFLAALLLVVSVGFAIADSGSEGEEDACFVVATLAEAKEAGLVCDVDTYPHLDPSNVAVTSGTPFTAEEIAADLAEQHNPDGE